MCNADPLVTFPDLAIDREIKQLKIYCPNKGDGCLWVGELSVVTDHLKYGMGCDITCTRCQDLIHHKAMIVHTNSECPCYCQYCDSTGDREVISAQHKEKCNNYPLPCPNQCGQDSIPLCDMDKHKKVCPLEMVQCPQCGVEVTRKDREIHNRDNKLQHQFFQQLTTLERSFATSNKDINNKVDTLMGRDQGAKKIFIQLLALLFLLTVISIVVLVYVLTHVVFVTGELQELKQMITLLNANDHNDEQLLMLHDKIDKMTTQDLFSSEINRMITLLKSKNDLVPSTNTTTTTLLTNVAHNISTLVQATVKTNILSVTEQLKQNTKLIENHTTLLMMNLLTNISRLIKDSHERNRTHTPHTRCDLEHANLLLTKMGNDAKQQTRELKLLINDLKHENKQLTELLTQAKKSWSATSVEGKEERCHETASNEAASYETCLVLPTQSSPISQNGCVMRYLVCSAWLTETRSSYSWYDLFMRYIVWPVVIGLVKVLLLALLWWCDGNCVIVAYGTLITLAAVSVLFVGTLLGGVLSCIVALWSTLHSNKKEKVFFIYVLVFIISKLLLVDVLCMPWSRYWWLV